MCECMTGKTGECGSRVGVGEIESVNPIFKGIALPFLFLGSAVGSAGGSAGRGCRDA